MSDTILEELILVTDDGLVSEHTPGPARQRALELGAEFVGPDDPAEIIALVEALLLVSPGPATADELALGAGLEQSQIEGALAEIEGRTHEGWVLQRHGNRVQLTTAPRFATHIRRFLGLDREARLSPAALETVAIIAYQQPATRSEIEAVRGVDSSGVIATLLNRGLIEQVGRVPAPGNPIQYATTPDFLLHFGLRSLSELPPLGAVGEQDVRASLEAMMAASELEPVDAPM